jgi:hypothetical protein
MADVRHHAGRRLRQDCRMDHRWADLARTLRSLGLWRHLSEDEANAAERKVVEVRWPFGSFGDQPGGFWFLVDGEEMAEGFVSRELADMAPSLREHGVDLHVEEVSFPSDVEEGDYVIAINGRRCVVWTPQDWVDQSAWETATVRPLAVINDLLAEAGATPRLFTLYTGANEGIAWLLDPRIVAAIAASGLLSDREVPALASHR